MDSEAGKLFIGGIHWNTTDEGLKAYFEQFGQVVDTHIMRDPTGKSRCFGFVSFADPSVLDLVLQKTHILDNKQIDPKRAVPKHLQPHPQNPYLPMLAAAGVTGLPAGQTPYSGGQASFGGVRPQKPMLKDDFKIFVGGIHIAVEEAELKEFFSRYDTVLDVSLMRDHTTGRSRGFGFVTFASMTGVSATVAEKFIEYQGRRMEIKQAVPKGRQASSGPNVPGQMPYGSSSTPALAAAGMDPAQYAAMAEYYKNAYAAQGQQTATAATPGANPILTAMTAAGYTDPKAYLEAMQASYTQSYGAEYAAQAMAYYAPYIAQLTGGGSAPNTTSTTATSTSTTTTTTMPTTTSNGTNYSDKGDVRRSATGRSRSRSRSPRSRSRSRSRSISPHRDRYSSRRESRDSRDRRHETRSSRYNRSRSRSRSRSGSPPPPPPPPPAGRRDRSNSPDDRRSYSSRRK